MSLLGLLLVAGGPDAAAIAKLEEGRVLESLASPIKSPRKYVVEFAVKAEARNVKCVEVARERFNCTFESRVATGLSRTDFGPWKYGQEIVERDGSGWRFETVETAE